MPSVASGQEKMTRILFYSEGWGLGGIERFVMNSAELLDRERYRFDVFCTHDWDESYDQRIHELGGRRFCVFKGHKPNLVRRLRASLGAWRQLLETGAYGAVHVNIMNGVGFLYARVAERCGVPVRIVHSHNTSYGSGHALVKGLAHSICKRRYVRCATRLLACSEEAGRYLFDDRPFTVVPNTVDTGEFRFDQAVRRDVRETLGIPDESLLFGSIGRLAPEKNPLFQIEVLAELRGRGIDARLLLVGSGPEEEAMAQLAQSLEVADCLVTPGATNRASIYLCALDVASIPSSFEGGSPLSVTEAIACGCPCVVAEGIDARGLSKPFAITSAVGDTARWADAILEAYGAAKELDRGHDGLELVRSLGYDNEANRTLINGLYC